MRAASGTSGLRPRERGEAAPSPAPDASVTEQGQLHPSRRARSPGGGCGKGQPGVQGGSEGPRAERSWPGEGAGAASAGTLQRSSWPRGPGGQTGSCPRAPEPARQDALCCLIVPPLSRVGLSGPQAVHAWKAASQGNEGLDITSDFCICSKMLRKMGRRRCG